MKKKFGIIPIIILIGCNSNQTVEYYSNGIVKEDCNKITSNQRKCKYYNETGLLQGEKNYLDNQLHGVQKLFHSNGQIKEMANYSLGKLNGYREINDENGKLINRDRYLYGMMHGKCYDYSKDGKTSKEYYYCYGSQKLFKQYFENKLSKFYMVKYYSVENGNGTFIGEVRYDFDWNPIPNKSFYYIFKANKDTVDRGDIYTAEIEVFSPSGTDSIKVYVGEKQPSQRDLSALVAIKDNQFQLRLLAEKKGYQDIRGFVVEYKTLGDKKIILRKMPIYESYFVN